MAVDRVLLDTTIQLWRIAYGPKEAGRIHRELVGAREVLTTSFVFREFLNTIIADIEFVHAQASSFLQPGEDGYVGMDQLARFLATGQGNYSSRSIQRLHLVIGKLLESFARTRVPKGKLLVRLERTASRWIRDFFRYLDENGSEQTITCLTGLDDETDSVSQLINGRVFPPRPSFPQATARFLEGAKSQVQRVEVEMRASTKARGRDDKLLKALGWLKDEAGRFDFANKLQTYKLWNWALGDLLIALETPEGVAIYSTDRAFRILSLALEKPRHSGYRVPS